MSVTLLLISCAATSVRVRISTADSAQAITMMRAIPACPRSPLRKPLMHFLLEGAWLSLTAGQVATQQPDGGAVADVGCVGLDVAVAVQVGLCVDQVVLDRDESLAAVAHDLGDVAQDAPGNRSLDVDQDAFDGVQAGLGGDQGALGV